MPSIEDIANQAVKAFECGHPQDVGELLREVIASFLQPFALEAARAIELGDYKRVKLMTACLLEHTDGRISIGDIHQAFDAEGGDPTLVPNGWSRGTHNTVSTING